ncbi:MAG TPA: hypothetical protein VK701_00745 [Solirubrobacteraceae bacterium]|jgi:hypothetical protein|nr:hypothetical protein [Solirubrobacteraceae bacterium]
MQFGSRKPKSSLKSRKAERELFFWTARQGLWLVTFAAFVVYSVISMAEGHIPAIELLLRKL